MKYQNKYMGEVTLVEQSAAAIEAADNGMYRLAAFMFKRLYFKAVKEGWHLTANEALTSYVVYHKLWRLYGNRDPQPLDG